MIDTGYTDSPVGRTWKVGKLIDELMKFDRDKPVILCNDGFNTFPMTARKLSDENGSALVGVRGTVVIKGDAA